MGVRSRMQYTGAGVGHVGHDVDHLQRVHPLDGGSAVALQSECDDAARTVGQVFLSEGVGLVAWQAAVVHPRHLLVLAEELGHLLGVLAVLGHTQMECLQTEMQQERVLRSGNRTEVTHQLCYEFCGEAHLAEGLHIGQTMIALIGCAEAGEFLGVGEPVEVTAIDYDAAHLRSQAIHILRSRVGDDVGSPLKRTTVHGCGEGVIHDQRHAVLMGDFGEALDIEDRTAGIGDCLAEHCLRIRTESRLNLLVAGILRDKRAVDAQFLQRHTEEVVGATVDFIRGDEMVACLTDIEDGIEVGSLTA